MIVIIPLGGTGERFKKLGYTNPKALIEVEQTPILFHLLDKTNLFIISHKLDVLDDKFPAKITVEKHKNFSTMEYR